MPERPVLLPERPVLVAHVLARGVLRHALDLHGGRGVDDPLRRLDPLGQLGVRQHGASGARVRELLLHQAQRLRQPIEHVFDHR